MVTEVETKPSSCYKKEKNMIEQLELPLASKDTAKGQNFINTNVSKERKNLNTCHLLQFNVVIATFTQERFYKD